MTIRTKHATGYKDDLATWATEQADALRGRRWDDVDIEHVAEEIEDLAKSDRRALRSHYSGLLAHLMKWKFASAEERERTGRGWLQSIANHRAEIDFILDDSPSLRALFEDPQWFAKIVEHAIAKSSLDSSRTGRWQFHYRDILKQGWLPPD